jgi:DNA-binding response OmpR family regulator
LPRPNWTIARLRAEIETREAIEPRSRCNSVSNRDTDVSDRTVDALAARLPRKLQPPAGTSPIIVTLTGVGYKPGVCTDAN